MLIYLQLGGCIDVIQHLECSIQCMNHKQIQVNSTLVNGFQLYYKLDKSY